MNIWIVVPAYNEEKTIRRFLKDIKKINYPVVIIDDGSLDKTRQALKSKKLTVLHHKVNLGKGAAMRTGAEYAFENNAKAVIFMDSDGQHKIEDLQKFIDVLKKRKYDVIIGERNLTEGVPFVRFMGNKIGSLLVQMLFGIRVNDLLCGYRALTKKGYENLNLSSTGYGIETEMIAKVGMYKIKFCTVPVKTVYYDKYKGVSILDAFKVLFDVIAWRFRV